MLARYGFVYGRIPFGDVHALSHFVEEFCPGAVKIHVDIDPAEINKVIQVDCAIVGDARAVKGQGFAGHGNAILDLQRGRILLQNMGKLTAVARNE